MKTTTPCAYFYSDQPVNDLKANGFTISSEERPEMGCKVQTLALEDGAQAATELRFIEVLDEELYLKSFPDRSKVTLKPHLESVDAVAAKVSHANTVFVLKGIVQSADLKDEPWKDFLKIRKHPGLAAVILGCHDFEKASSLIGFYKTFDYQSKKYGLVHLGPESFDLLITQA